MHKEVLGKSARASTKSKDSEVEEMVQSIASPKATEAEEVNPTHELPAHMLTWFVTTEVLRCSRMSINMLQVALAYFAGVKPEIHKELCAAVNRRAELAIQITGFAGLTAQIKWAD